jgi:hypothetical protein
VVPGQLGQKSVREHISKEKRWGWWYMLGKFKIREFWFRPTMVKKARLYLQNNQS